MARRLTSLWLLVPLLAACRPAPPPAATPAPPVRSAPAPPQPEPGPPTREEVRELWQQGAQYYHDGKLREALAVWQMALQLDPGNDAIREKVERVRQELAAQER